MLIKSMLWNATEGLGLGEAFGDKQSGQENGDLEGHKPTEILK
jgi:hypothetical protein